MVISKRLKLINAYMKMVKAINNLLLQKYSNLVMPAATLVGVILLYLVPAGWLFGNGKGICLFKNLLGINCPGCGITRGLYLIVHMKVHASLSYNPAAIFIAMLLFLEILSPFINAKKQWIWVSKICYRGFLLTLSANYLYIIYNQLFFHHK